MANTFIPLETPEAAPIDGGQVVVNNPDTTVGTGTFEHFTDHAERMASRLIEIFRKPRNMSWLRDVAGPQVQELEDVIWALSGAFNLDTSTGKALDMLGAVVGELRADRIDSAYRTAIRVRLLVNQSEGTLEELIRILITAEPSLVTREREYYPASVVFTWTEPFTNITARDMYTLLRQAKPAGVSLHAVIKPASGGFRWGTVANAGASTAFSFSSVGGTDGGTLQQVLG